MSRTTIPDLSEGLTAERRAANRIHAFSNMISGIFYGRIEQPLGISLSEWRVLRTILLRPGLSQAEVAADQGLNVMNVNRAVAGLREKRLVTMESDPADRRRTMLWATDLGKELGADMGERETAMYEHVFEVLSPREVQLLDEMMLRVNNSFKTRELPQVLSPSRDWARVLDPDSQR